MEVSTGLDTFCLTTELQSEIQTNVDEGSHTENQNDVHEVNQNEHRRFLILENSILPANINTRNSSDIMNKSLLSQKSGTTELQSEIQTNVDEGSHIKNQNDVQEVNQNENSSFLILENSILPVDINTRNSSDIMHKSFLSQKSGK